MASRMDEFRTFVSKHPSVRDEVLKGKKTWQNIYEDWVILGEDDEIWKDHKVSPNSKNEDISRQSPKKFEDLLSSENLKTIVGYIKKINPDTLSKTLNTIQKVLQITQGFTSGNPSGVYNANYNSWWN